MQLTTLLITLFTAATAQSFTAPAIALAGVDATTTAITEALPAEMTVEESVRAYFSDIPVLIEVARCESTFRHMKDGEILRGVANSDDVGVMQINEYYHGESAKRLGYDITTLDGNMAFARHLHEVYGTEAWSASAKCWKKRPVLAAKVSTVTKPVVAVK